ncbi:MAG: hypothetical protein IT179_01070 [Acidobacteria bacterium]|nr:hypothetical protein [Acidobacteriota bacterium]
MVMRTTQDLPDALIDDARAVLGFTSKTDTVVHALKEVARLDLVRLFSYRTS